MLPSEIAEIVDVIAPGWAEMVPEDQNYWIKIAQKIWDAGYRKPEQEK